MQSTSSEAEPLNENIDPLPESDSGEFGKVERISKKDMKPINDPKCKHEFEPDYTDETDYYLAMSCKHCIVGYLKPKNPPQKSNWPSITL